MEEMSHEKDITLSSEYEYGFHDEDVSLFLKHLKGLNEDISSYEISAIKGEPERMLQTIDLDALDRSFEKATKCLHGVSRFKQRSDFDEYTYYIRPCDKQEQVNGMKSLIRFVDTFDKLGIPEAEQKYLGRGIYSI